jgi:hypothetical protein
MVNHSLNVGNTTVAVHLILKSKNIEEADVLLCKQLVMQDGR